MEMSDEYQDMGNPGGGVAMVNIPITRHQHTPIESPLVSSFFNIFSFFPFIYNLLVMHMLTFNIGYSKNTGELAKRRYREQIRIDRENLRRPKMVCSIFVLHVH